VELGRALDGRVCRRLGPAVSPDRRSSRASANPKRVSLPLLPEIPSSRRTFLQPMAIGAGPRAKGVLLNLEAQTLFSLAVG